MEYQLSRFTKPLMIKSGHAVLPALLTLPPKAKGLIIFTHGRGSSRFSSRNQYLAKKLKKNHFATLLFDLLTPEESAEDALSAKMSFNIELLAERLLEATLVAEKHIPNIGYFGFSTGAAVALLAATLKKTISTVICSSGRPDLIWDNLPKVPNPTLFIAGGSDFTHLLAKRAFRKLICPKKMTIIPGANSLFEERGKLEEMSEVALKWFKKYVPKKKNYSKKLFHKKELSSL